MADGATNKENSPEKKANPEATTKKKIKLSILPVGAQLHRCLGILLKYDPNLDLDATFDQIMISAEKENSKLSPKNLDPEDKKRLKLMGLLWDNVSEHWILML